MAGIFLFTHLCAGYYLGKSKAVDILDKQPGSGVAMDSTLLSDALVRECCREMETTACKAHLFSVYSHLPGIFFKDRDPVRSDPSGYCQSRLHDPEFCNRIFAPDLSGLFIAISFGIWSSKELVKQGSLESVLGLGDIDRRYSGHGVDVIRAGNIAVGCVGIYASLLRMAFCIQLSVASGRPPPPGQLPGAPLQVIRSSYQAGGIKIRCFHARR